MQSDFEELTSRLARAKKTNDDVYKARQAVRQWLDQLVEALSVAVKAHADIDATHVAKGLRAGVKETREMLTEQYEFALVAYGCLVSERGVRTEPNPPPYWGYHGVEQEYLDVLSDPVRRSAALETLMRERAVKALSKGVK